MVALLIIQSVVQGITEFLPVSSSGHLVLIWSAAAWMGVDTSFSSAEMLTLNVALHVGTLFAVIIYFWRLVWAAVLGGVDMLRWRDTDNRRLFVFLVIASFPLMVAGLLVAMFVPDLWLLNPLVVAGATLIFGLLLLFADIGFDSRRSADEIGLLDALADLQSGSAITSKPANIGPICTLGLHFVELVFFQRLGHTIAIHLTILLVVDLHDLLR